MEALCEFFTDLAITLQGREIVVNGLFHFIRGLNLEEAFKKYVKKFQVLQ